MTTYYVDATLGNDGNLGTSEGQAWQSIAQVNSSMGAFNPGDSIKFKRGEVWRDALEITCNGSAVGGDITFEGYGVGDEWTINGASVEAGWTALSGGDVVTNGDFESGDPPDDWLAVNSATLSQQGGGQAGNCMQIQENGATNPAARQVISVTAGQKFVLTAYHKQGTGTAIRFLVRRYTEGDILYDSGALTAGAGWAQVVGTEFTVPAGETQIDILIRHAVASGAGTNVLVDTVTLAEQAASNIYYKVFANRPQVCVEDDKYLEFVHWDTDAQTTLGGASPGSWTEDGVDTAYVICTDEADPDTHVMEVGANTGTDKYGIYLHGSEYITLDGFRVQYTTGRGVYGQGDAATGGVTHITVQNGTVYNTGEEAVIFTENQHTSDDFNNNITIDGLVVSYAREHGIFLQEGTSDSIIKYCYAHHCGWGGTGVGGTGGHNISQYSNNGVGKPSRNIVEYCIAEYCYCASDGSEGTGIQCDDLTTDSILRFNVSRYNQGSAYYDNGYGGNVWHHNIGYGSGTYTVGDFRGGLTISDLTTIEVYNNLLYDNSPVNIGMTAAISVSSTFRNNILAEASVFEMRVAIAAQANLDSDYNCIYNSSIASFMRWGGSSYNWANWKTNSGQDAHSINADPLLVNPASGDFHKVWGSPCINTGVDVGLTEDFDGNTIPMGEGFDIGPFEYIYLAVSDCTHAHTADNVVVEEDAYYLTVQDGLHAHIADSPALVETPLTPSAPPIDEDDYTDNWDRLILFEPEVGRHLEEQEWTQGASGYTNTWNITLPDDGEVVRVEEDGEAYTEVFSLADCEATSSTFFYDDLTKTLHVQTLGSDSPETLDTTFGSEDYGQPLYNLIAFFWEFISNRPKQLEPQENVLKYKNGGFEFWTSPTNAEEWTETLAGTSTINKEATEVDGDHSAYACRLDIDASNSEAREAITVSLRPGRKARIKVRCKMSTTGKTGGLVVTDSGNNVYLNSSLEWQAGATLISIPNSADYADFEVTFTTHPSYSEYEIRLRNNAAASASIYYDNIEIWRYRQLIDCRPVLPKGALPSVNQAVGEFYQPDEQINYGTVKINNADGWFWTRRDVYGYLWHGRRARLKIGHINQDYEDLEPFFTGVMATPSWGKVVEIAVEDDRVLLQRIPVDRFDEALYPDCETEWVNKPIPLLFGRVEDMKPPQIDTASQIFKVSQAVIGRVANYEWYLNDNCESLTGWTTALVGLSSITVKTLEGKSCFKFRVAANAPPVTGYARISKTISGGLPDSYELEVKIYFGEGIGQRAAPLCYFIEAWNGTFRLYASIDTDTIDVWDGAAWHTTASDQNNGNWYTFRFIVDGLTQTVDIYRNGALVVNGADCSDLTAATDGKVQLSLYGNQVTTIVLYTDFIRIFTETVIEAGTQYGIHSIEAVYKTASDGTKTELTEGVDYSADLDNGEFTVSAALADGDIITCNADGLKCSFEDLDWAYLPGDILYFLYTVLNGVSKYDLDIKSILDLNTYRFLVLGRWISEDIDSIDFLIELKRSAVFHTVPLLNGMFHFAVYKNAVPDDAPHFYVEDYIAHPKFRENTDGCYKSVLCRGHYYPYSAYYKWEDLETADEAEWNYGRKNQLPIDTMLSLHFQLRDLAENELSMVRKPPEIVEGITLPPSALLLNPCDKFYLTYELYDDDGTRITIYDDEVFRILMLDKELNSGHVTVKAIKDTASFAWTIGPE